MKLSEKQEEISKYIFDNYHEDRSSLINIPVIIFLIKNQSDMPEAKSIIDKVAIINGINKSYPSDAVFEA